MAIIPSASAEPLYRHTISADVLNVREGPGMEYPVIYKLDRGEVVHIVSDDNGSPVLHIDEQGVTWCYIRIDHWQYPIGWASKQYVQ